MAVRLVVLAAVVDGEAVVNGGGGGWLMGEQ